MTATTTPSQITPGLQTSWQTFVESADQLLAEAAKASCSDDSSPVHFRGLDAVCQSGYAYFAAFYLKSIAEDALDQVHVPSCWEIVGGVSSLEELQQDSMLLRFEERLLRGLEGFNTLVGRQAALLSEFSQQAWRALKAGSCSPVPAVHSLSHSFRTFAAIVLLETAPERFPDALRHYFGCKLKQYQALVGDQLGPKQAAYMQGSDDEGADVEEEDESEGEEEDLMDTDVASKSSLLSHLLAEDDSFTPVRRISEILKDLQLEDVGSRAYEAVIAGTVQKTVERMTKGRVTKSVLQTAQNFVGIVILPFLAMLLGTSVEGSDERLSEWRERLSGYIYQTVGSMRIEDLFDITKIFPDSAAAVRDLEACLQQCELQRALIRVFRRSCATRLHIPGAKTNDIIDVYVNSIKILRQVDPTGVLLEAVSGPTREYLKGRKDTIRCIVSAMTDDKSEVGGESLFDELQRPATQDEEDEENEDDAFALSQFQTWQPEPVNADIQQAARAQGMLDIISMLVQIYGSKDLFINEYRGMLAERLLAKSSFDMETEIRTLELLKMRFGESNLHNCEVMMKDVGDSKRLFNTIRAMPENLRSPVRNKKRAAAQGVGPVSATIISALFWPQLQEEELQLPDQIEDFLDEYAAKYWVAKQPRKLQWKKHLGAVELTLKLGTSSKDFTVAPFEAAILMHFQGTSLWSAEALAKELGTSSEVLRRKAAFWIKHGVLIEAQSDAGQLTYGRAASLDGSGQPGGSEGPIAMEEDESSSALISHEDQLQKEMAMYEQYVVGMLTNFESGLSLERIHNMLKMFVPDQAYDKSSEQLSGFLSQLVADEKLRVSGDVYTKRS